MLVFLKQAKLLFVFLTRFIANLKNAKKHVDIFAENTNFFKLIKHLDSFTKKFYSIKRSMIFFYTDFSKQTKIFVKTLVKYNCFLKISKAPSQFLSK